MTSKRAKVKVKEFELGEEFHTKYSDFNRIYAIGKVLILEHYTGALIQSSYYSDDSIKTLKTLRNTLVGNNAINAEFNIDEFLGAFGQVLARSIVQEAEDEKAQTTEDQQQKNIIQEEIKQLKEQHPDITVEQWQSTLNKNTTISIILFNSICLKYGQVWISCYLS